MKRKFQTLLMISFILASHVNHVASTIMTSKSIPKATLTKENPSESAKPRKLRMRHHRGHHHRGRRHMRHRKNALRMTNPYPTNYMPMYANGIPMGYAAQMNNLQGHRHLFDLGGMIGSVTGNVGNAVGGIGNAVGGGIGGAGGALGGTISGIGNALQGKAPDLQNQQAAPQAAAQPVAQEVAPAEEGGDGGGGGLLGGIGGAIDGVGDSVGSALGLGGNAGTGLAIGGAAAGAGYMMRKKRQREHQAKVRMLDQQIAMKDFQSGLVDQEYQLLLHANRDLHSANGRISNLERNAVYRINARILDYAIGAYY